MQKQECVLVVVSRFGSTPLVFHWDWQTNVPLEQFEWNKWLVCVCVCKSKTRLHGSHYNTVYLQSAQTQRTVTDWEIIRRKKKKNKTKKSVNVVSIYTEYPFNQPANAQPVPSHPTRAPLNPPVHNSNSNQQINKRTNKTRSGINKTATQQSALFF